VLKCSNLVSGEDKTKASAKIVDLVQRRKANCHASPFTRFRSLGDKNEKSHPRPEKAPNGINAAAIDGHVSYGAKRENSFVMHVFTYHGIVS
jgi:hypothetical protein